MLCPALFALVAAAGCQHNAPAQVTVIDTQGVKRTVSVDPLALQGAKEGRGFVDVGLFLAGDATVAELDLKGRDEHRTRVLTKDFPTTLRLFYAKDGKLRLVRFVGDGGAPLPASGDHKEGGRRHRDRWDTLIDDVSEVMLVKASPTGGMR